MLITLLLFALFIASLIGVIHYLILKEKKPVILCCAAALLVCGLFGLFLIEVGDGFRHRLTIDKGKLEAFVIDLDTQEQYEEWLCPEERTETKEEYPHMTKEIKLGNPPVYVSVGLTLYPDTQTAMQAYERIIEYPWRYYQRKTIELNEDYEYYFTKTRTDLTSDHLFALLSNGDYETAAGIRYKNIIFEFSEYSHQRKSRIGEAIDQLLAEYEQYKAGM